MNITSVLSTYGLQPTCIAVAVILLIGVIKLVFKKKLEALGSAKTKSIYESLSIVFSFGFTAAWLAASVYLFHLQDVELDWEEYLITGSTTYIVVKVLYPLYENYHVRDFLSMVGKAILELFRKKKTTGSTETAPVAKVTEVLPVEPISVVDEDKVEDTPKALEVSKAAVKPSTPEAQVVNRMSDLGTIK